jgi:hypothetical protein
MKIFRRIYKFFDHLEDKTRGLLSHYPIIYALIGGIGIVLFWRGVWHIADEFAFMTGWLSIIIGTICLLLTGLFVSVFIGDQVIISGLRGEKKVAEKTESEVEEEEEILSDVRRELRRIHEKLDRINK